MQLTEIFRKFVNYVNTQMKNEELKEESVLEVGYF